MLLRYSILSLFGSLSVVYGVSTNVTVEELINAVGAPKCMQKCVNSFIVDLHDALTNSSIKNATRVMCDKYDLFVDCARNDRYVCPYEMVYNFTFEGINSFCSKKDAPHSECLDKQFSFIAGACDKKCHLAHQIDDMFQRRTIKIMAKHSGNPQVFIDNLTEFCQSLSCFIPCFKRSLEYKCGEEGHHFLVHAARPFYSLVREIKNKPGVKPLIEKRIPKTCHFLFNKAVLDYYTTY